MTLFQPASWLFAGMIDRFVHRFIVSLFQPPLPRLRPGLMNQMAIMYED